MQTLSKQVMQCPPNQAGHDVATRQRTGKRQPVCTAEGGPRGHRKDKHKQDTNKQHKHNNDTNFGEVERGVDVFLHGDVLAKISALAFLAGRSRSGWGSSFPFPLSFEGLL